MGSRACACALKTRRCSSPSFALRCARRARQFMADVPHGGLAGGCTPGQGFCGAGAPPAGQAGRARGRGEAGRDDRGAQRRADGAGAGARGGFCLHRHERFMPVPHCGRPHEPPPWPRTTKAGTRRCSALSAWRRRRSSRRAGPFACAANWAATPLPPRRWWALGCASCP